MFGSSMLSSCCQSVLFSSSIHLLIESGLSLRRVNLYYAVFDLGKVCVTRGIWWSEGIPSLSNSGLSGGYIWQSVEGRFEITTSSIFSPRVGNVTCCLKSLLISKIAPTESMLIRASSRPNCLR